jgi:hypothetical protein
VRRRKEGEEPRAPVNLSVVGTPPDSRRDPTYPSASRIASRSRASALRSAMSPSPSSIGPSGSASESSPAAAAGSCLTTSASLRWTGSSFLGRFATGGALPSSSSSSGRSCPLMCEPDRSRARPLGAGDGWRVLNESRAPFEVDGAVPEAAAATRSALTTPSPLSRRRLLEPASSGDDIDGGAKAVVDGVVEERERERRKGVTAREVAPRTTRLSRGPRPASRPAGAITGVRAYLTAGTRQARVPPLC